MSKIVHTQLRALQSKSLETLLFFVNTLPFKIEIKGQPILNNKKKYVLFFVIPENIGVEHVLKSALLLDLD